MCPEVRSGMQRLHKVPVSISARHFHESQKAHGCDAIRARQKSPNIWTTEPGPFTSCGQSGTRR